MLGFIIWLAIVALVFYLVWLVIQRLVTDANARFAIGAILALVLLVFLLRALGVYGGGPIVFW